MILRRQGDREFKEFRTLPDSLEIPWLYGIWSHRLLS
jgi:hypothetical protein